MIKGIYNENEFYTNHYWSSKFFDDLASKTQTIPDLKNRANTIKELGDQYWDLIEAKDASKVEHTERFVQFYQNLLKVLGYSFDPKKRQTVEGLYYSVATEVKQDSKSHLLIALTESNESGSFESLPLELVKLNKEDEDEAEDRDLAEITSEELDSETGPKWFIVGAMDNLHLIQRGKWSYGRFIRVNLSEIFAQKDDKAYTTLLGLFSKEILAPELGLSIHEELDDNSHRHAFAVTTELREGVRESIELLINEMIYAKKEAHQEYLKKDKDADEYAKELTHDALFYVYRLIFLLFLESQGDDSELLPLKSEIYRHGYSLEKLLEIAFKQIHEGTQEYEGTFIQESLERIFDLIFNGFVPQRSGDFLTENLSSTGFLVKGLKSDLFDPAKVKHLKGVSLRNGILQRMLQKLSMADIKEGKKTRKARVSYANLGINQLGAVYEGLLSYTGFFAKEDLYELTQVKKGKDDVDDSSDSNEESSTKATKVDPDKIYLAPKSLVEKYKKDKKYKLTDKHFVLDKETGEPVRYKKGSFIFRMAGRDRQKLASYYTPESLTKCTVKYALKVLFENKKTLEELRKVKILEPAMGSGAFLNEAVNQLADKIIELEVKENSSTLKTPKDRQKRLWEIKYDLISNNVYGVDLNPTAIELARFSLWLNCIGAGKAPPQFTSQFKVGNSLIGARFKKNADGIYPWLVLDSAMMDYGKKLKDYDKTAAQNIEKFRNDFLKSEVPINSVIKEIQLKVERLLKDLAAGQNTSVSYERLKFCSDFWCSTYFLSEKDLKYFPSTHEAFLEIISQAIESGPTKINPELYKIVSRISREERFFHWDIEFAPQISNGGFELILGNPPWVAVEWEDSLYVSDYNIIPLVNKFNAADTRKFIETLDEPDIFSGLSSLYIRVAGYSKMLESGFFHELKGISKNTYKFFDLLGIHYLAHGGAIGIIQEDGLLEDKKATAARSLLYSSLRFHFQFQNEKLLFAEVLHGKKFSINILSSKKDPVEFHHIGNLFLTSTIDESYADHSTDNLSIKNTNGEWETKGNNSRVIHIDKSTLNLFSSLTGDRISPRMINFHSNSVSSGFKKLATNSMPIKNFLMDGRYAISEMINETSGQDNGIIEVRGARTANINSLVLSGPNIFTNLPLYGEPKLGTKNKNMYDRINLIERTNFNLNTIYIASDLKRIDDTYSGIDGVPFRQLYRIVTRGMVHPGNERMSFACILPPGPSYINGIKGIGLLPNKNLLIVQGFLQSLLTDSFIRAKGISNIFSNDLLEFLISRDCTFHDSIARRIAKLNLITKDYEVLHNKVRDIFDTTDETPNFNVTTIDRNWSANFPVREPLSRLEVETEIEALIALSFKLTPNEINGIVRAYMGVLVSRDQKNSFDRNVKLIEAYNFFEKRGY